MSIEAVYASALPGAENSFIRAIVIESTGLDTVRFCDGFKDRMLGVSGVAYRFQCGSLEASLPSYNTSGQQSLRFAVPNINGTIRRRINAAMQAGNSVYMTYLEYLAGDQMVPFSRPVRMHITGISLEGITATFQGSYKDLLNLAFGNQQRYTAETAPGLRFSS